MKLVSNTPLLVCEALFISAPRGGGGRRIGMRLRAQRALMSAQQLRINYCFSSFSVRRVGSMKMGSCGGRERRAPFPLETQGQK